MRRRSFFVTLVRVILWLQVGFGAILAAISGADGFSSATGAPQQAAAAAMALLIAIAPYVLARAWDELAWNAADQRDCRYCGESIRVNATLCRFCGRDQPVEEPTTVAPRPHRIRAVVLAVVLFLLIALPWPLVAAADAYGFALEVFVIARNIALAVGLIGAAGLVLGFTWHQLGDRRATLALFTGAGSIFIASAWYGASTLLPMQGWQ